MQSEEVHHVWSMMITH